MSVSVSLTRIILIAVLFACTFIAYLERTGFSIAFTEIAKEAGLDQGSKGMVMAAFYYGYAATQIPGGWAAAEWGAHRVLAGSFALWSLASLLTPANGHTLGLIVLARVMVGASQGVIFPALHTVLAATIPAGQRSRAVATVTSGMYLGSATATLTLSAFAPGLVFRSMGALGCAWLLIWLQLGRAGIVATRPVDAKPAPVDGGESGDVNSSPGSDKERRRQRLIPWDKLLSSSAVWAIVANNFSFHYAFYVLMSWMPTYFDQKLKASLAVLGATKMMPYLVMFVFNLLSGYVGDFLIVKGGFKVVAARKMLNNVGFIFSAVALWVMPIMPTVNGALLLASLALGGAALARGGFAVNHMDIAPQHAGVLMGLSNTAGTLAGVVGVSLTGFLLQTAPGGAHGDAGWVRVFGVPAALSLISALIFSVFAKGERIF